MAQYCPDWNQAPVSVIPRACDGVPLSHILGKLPLIPAGNHCTIPRCMHCRKDASYPQGVCDRQVAPGSGSPLFYINTWAMIWPLTTRPLPVEN
jgi:hypothetical protein